MSEPLVAIQNDCEAFSTLDSGAEFERVPINYLVHQTGAAWKIAVTATAL